MNPDEKTQASEHRIEVLPIVGQIEGHYYLSEGTKTTKYEQILPHLAKIEEEGYAKGLLLLLHTVGGDVEAGMAIAETVAGMSIPTVSLVLGGGHSIGAVLAASAKHSLIVPTATMTIHPVRYHGTVIGAPQSFRYLSEMQNRVLSFLKIHAGVCPDKLRELMLRTDDMASDLGTILTGKEAVELGLIDGVGGIADAISILRKMQ